MPEPFAFLNGEFLPQSQAHLSLNDAGFVFGATVTELCRTFGQRLYRWDDHCRRLRASADAVGINLPIAAAELTERAYELILRNAELLPPGQEQCLIAFATSGPIGYYLGESGSAGDASPTFGMHTFPLPYARYRRLIELGAELLVPGVQAVPAACVDPRIKQRSRLHWWLAEREVRAVHPGAQALLSDAAGHVTETAAANFLIVKDGVVISPPEGAVLPGISLQAVRELCERLDIDFAEKPLSVAECVAADEAMLTSTPYGIAGVRSLNQAELSWPGPVYQRLRNAWSAEIGTDLHAGF